MRLLDIKGVADKLRVSERTVERMKAAGELPPHVILPGTNCHRWREDELDELIAGLPRFDAVGQGGGR